jgi:hypothetical protein
MALDDDLIDNDFESVFKNKVMPWVGGIIIAGSVGYGIYKAGKFFCDYFSDFVNYFDNCFGF